MLYVLHSIFCGLRQTIKHLAHNLVRKPHTPPPTCRLHRRMYSLDKKFHHGSRTVQQQRIMNPGGPMKPVSIYLSTIYGVRNFVDWLAAVCK